MTLRSLGGSPFCLNFFVTEFSQHFNFCKFNCGEVAGVGGGGRRCSDLSALRGDSWGPSKGRPCLWYSFPVRNLLRITSGAFRYHHARASPSCFASWEQTILEGGYKVVLEDTIQVELTQTAGGETRVDKTKSRHFYLKVNAKALMIHS